MYDSLVFHGHCIINSLFIVQVFEEWMRPVRIYVSIVLPFAVVSLFKFLHDSSSSQLQMFCLFPFMQILPRLVVPLQFTIFLVPQLSIKPFLRIKFMVPCLNHPQKRKRSCQNFFEKVSKMTKMMSMERKNLNQLCKMLFQNLHRVLLISLGLSLLVVVKEPRVRIAYPLGRNQLNLCRGAFQACLHAVASVREEGRQRQVLQ